MIHRLIYFIKILILFTYLEGNEFSGILSSRPSTVFAMDGRIVGGHSTTILDHPYMVSIRLKNHFICGGTLVSATCVMTAAHCSMLASPSKWTIHAGTTFLKSRGYIRHVSKWMVPADFNFFTIDMDIALLQLTEPLDATRIRPIALDLSPIQEKEHVLVTGWGLKAEYPQSKLSNQLQVVNVTLTNIEKCQRAYQEQNNVTENMFCAIGDFVGDACQGDSGGPAIRDGKQVGIVSWGYRCGAPAYPGVYTRLSSANISKFITYLMPLYC